MHMSELTPESRIIPSEGFVPHVEYPSGVAEEYLIATGKLHRQLSIVECKDLPFLRKPKRKRAFLRGDERTRTLEQSLNLNLISIYRECPMTTNHVRSRLGIFLYINPILS